MDKINVLQIEKLFDIKELLLEFNEVFDPKISSKFCIEEYAKKIFYNGNIYVAKNNEALGFITFYSNDTVNKIAYVTLIGVKTKARRKNIGKSLLNICYEKSKDQGMRYIKLEVKKDNLNAQKFYKKEGFTFFEETTNESIYMMKKFK